MAYAAPLCAAVGLELDDVPGEAAVAPPLARVRSAEFRVRVLRAYALRCAFCGYDGKAGVGLALSPIGVAAAHVHWHALGGPDTVTNGLALCDLHHTLFDRGVLGVDEQRRILVSDAFHGESEVAHRFVEGLRGRDLGAPRAARDRVTDERLAWHRKQVFHAVAG